MESPEETGQGEMETQGKATGQGRLRLSKMVQSAEGGKGKEKRKRIIVVVRSPCQMHTPARTGQCWSRQTQHGHGVCIWMHLVNGMGNSPSLRKPAPESGVVKQEKSSRGSNDTTKTRLDPQRVRTCKGERPIGGANGKQANTMATCRPSPQRRRRISS